jgi:hypothetical protein
MSIIVSGRRHDQVVEKMREANSKAVQEMRDANSRTVDDMASKLKRTEDGIVSLRKLVQELVVDNILTVQGERESYTGNEYKTYESAVTAIDKKYRNEADWGVAQTATIIDLRSAFILGEGPQVRATTATKGEAQKELDFCKAFFEYNGLDYEMAQENTKEAEIEGKVALRLVYDAGEYRTFKGMVSVRFISWLDKRYEVTADPDDYLWYRKLSWKGTDGNSPTTVEEPEFVYKKFGGRICKPNEAQPKIAHCLSQIDRLDKAIRDLREINHLFASPTPDFEVEDGTQATLLLQQIALMNWRIGKAIAHVGKFKMVTVDMSGVANLIAEIELLMKIISGCVSIPIHYLGLLDLLKNRATGDNTRELIMASTTKERQIWTGAYNELVTKAMELYNKEAGVGQKSDKGGRLDPTRVEVTIPQITEEHWAHIRDVYLAAATAGVIDPETAAAQIPGIDMEAEREKAVKREQSAAQAAQAELERIKIMSASEDKKNDKQQPRA